MPLTINLPDDEQALLAAKAQARGVTTEEYVHQVIAHDLAIASPASRHIAEIIRENMSRVPPEVMATMPKDGASEHDHYIYGLPKRNP
ncbi:MAG: hypothetical protein JOZ48_22490 [Acidobacteriaceae bacterium]|nr:hypothetical protein [Acidobacteriaceae bacterium]